MIFFDNQMNNCNTVSSIGVTVVYTPEGVTRKAFEVNLDSLKISSIINCIHIPIEFFRVELHNEVKIHHL